jgi:hypothetical protein
MPCAFLSDFQVARECRGGNAFLMVRDEPDRHKPLAERELCVVKDCPDFDAETLPALAALVGLTIGEVIDAGSAAVGAELTIAPADIPQMVKAGLFVREGFEEIEEAFKLGEHGVISLDNTNIGSP